MITFANYISGQMLRKVSMMVIFLFPSIRNQYLKVKQTVLKHSSNMQEIPQQLVYSLIVIEDRRYFKHKGVDFYSIIRALFNNIKNKRIEGASTIVQQLVRNITDEREIKMKRKIKEVLFASLLDKEFSKKRIIASYLNTYQFGNSKGIQSLCEAENYDLNNLSTYQSAEIAARFKFPTVSKNNYIKYLKRVRTIERKSSYQHIESKMWGCQFEGVRGSKKMV